MGYQPPALFRQVPPLSLQFSKLPIFRRFPPIYWFFVNPPKNRIFEWNQCYWNSLHKRWSFPLRISPVNVTKSAGNCKWKLLNGKRHFLCSDCSSLTPSYLLKVNKSLVKTSQFKFLVMTKKNIFVYKRFLLLNISDFSYFLCKNCTFWKK